ncbi:MAG: TspO/MBR family protein [Phycisphaeraceae bacterium]
MRSAGVLIGLLVVCFAAAALGSLLTVQSVGTWYQQLARPTWTPPDWLFGPVWTLLYAMMAVAAWLVWRKAGWSGSPWALGVFGLQLVLNVAWSGIFFGLRLPGAALAELVALWAAILATAVLFARVSWPAAGLMIAYLLWVSFAGALNFAIWRMNG